MTDDRFDYYTVKEFAAMRGVSPRTVRDWIRERWIQAERTAGERGQWRVKVLKIAQAS